MFDSVEKMHVRVGSIIFADEPTGFCIFRASAGGEEKGVLGDITAKGYVGCLQKNDEILIWGEWEKHPKFGSQIKISRHQLAGMEERGTFAFLQSGFVKGVGPSLAKAIWDKFGEDTAHVMDYEPKRLLEVKGVGPSKLDMITTSWGESRDKQKALVKFQEWGIGPMTIQKIFKAFPDSPLETVEKDPYVLAWEIDGVGFLTADKIAQSAGMDEDAKSRLGAGIYYTLQEASQKEGHCFLDREDLVKRTEEILWPEKESRTDAKKGWIRKEIDALVESRHLIEDDGRIYTPVFYNTERSLAKHLGRLVGGVKPFPYDIGALIAQCEKQDNMTFDPKQKQAIHSALNSKVCVITGGPGTGKTTIVQTILKLAQQGGMRDIGLVAPTGRAAKRLSESTGHDASTIHRYLGYSPQSGFGKNEKDQVEDDLVICDEASMLDVFLAKALAGALPRKARLILVGDVHQLPSVGAGNVLRDMIRSYAVPVTELDTIHRQAEGSWITRNAHAIKNGNLGGINLSNKAEDFFFVDLEKEFPEMSTRDRSFELKERLLQAIQKLITQMAYKPDQVQVLSPIHKGPVGVGELNQSMQEMLNPPSQNKTEVRIGFKLFRQGDRVMQLKNNYSKEVFNGDQGWIVEIDREEGQMTVMFNGAHKTYEFLDADELTLAYACSIHKSQGSEYRAVVAPVTASHYIMLQRNLLYTAVTRAKKVCVLMGEKKAVGIAVRNNRPIQRNTALEELLAESAQVEEAVGA